MKKVLIILLGVIALTVIKLLIPSKDINTQELYQYCKNNGYSSEYCILVDFSRPSGLNRFYIYSFKENKIIHKSLCANGRGKNNNIFNSTFSNKIGSNYSSLGKYRIGSLRKMYSNPNRKGFTLYGLDTTNSNALARGILIHNGNPPFELFPLPAIPMSRGCFAVSNGMMKKISEIQNKTNKPILLYAYK